jgi:hypothetical protein
MTNGLFNIKRRQPVTLMLHRGAHEIDYPGLRRLDTPPATSSHVPIEHFRVVDLVKSTLFMYGHEVTAEHHGVTEDGMRYFGVLSLRSTYTGYEDMVALRNSNDRSFPVSIGFGSRVFCCDNMALVADHVIRRKHTANLKRDLPGIIGELIEPLTLQREAQHRTIERYRQTNIPNALADHAILSMYRRRVINVQRIPDVLEHWEKPTFEEFKERRTAWRLFNAATYALTGRIVDRPNATPMLHEIIDATCEQVH